VNAAVETLASRWRSRPPRERAVVALGAAVVAGALAWTFLWQPLVRDLDATERELAQAREREALAQALAADAATLSRQAKAPATADPRAAVQRTLAAGGLRAAVDAQDGGVRVTLPAVTLDALVPWLDAAAREEQLFPAELTITRRVEPGLLRAEITLVR